MPTMRCPVCGAESVPTQLGKMKMHLEPGSSQTCDGTNPNAQKPTRAKATEQEESEESNEPELPLRS